LLLDDLLNEVFKFVCYAFVLLYHGGLHLLALDFKQAHADTIGDRVSDVTFMFNLGQNVGMDDFQILVQFGRLLFRVNVLFILRVKCVLDVPLVFELVFFGVQQDFTFEAFEEFDLLFRLDRGLRDQGLELLVLLLDPNVLVGNGPLALLLFGGDVGFLGREEG